jgi:hypothetical protein
MFSELNNPIKYIDPDGCGEKLSYLRNTNSFNQQSDANDFLIAMGLMVGSLSLSLFFPGFGAFIGGLTLVGYLSIFFTTISFGLIFISLWLKMNHKEDFADVMFEWLEKNGYKTKDINQILSNENEDEITLIMEDGTYVTLKKGFLGWDVIDEGRIGKSDINDTKEEKNNILPGELPNNVSMT